MKYYGCFLAYAIVRLSEMYQGERACRRYKLKNVKLRNVAVSGDVSIGEGTYINSGQIQGGKNSKVVIGKNCNIGWNVFISSVTHPKKDSTNASLERYESDVKIGDRVWIGNNVVVREGITIGDNVVVGANSVVTHNVKPCEVVGGVPARALGQGSCKI